MDILFKSIDRSNLSEAKVGHNLITELYDELQEILERGKLGEDCRLFFARPVEAQSKQCIDWYSAYGDKGIPFAELSEDDARKLLDDASKIVEQLNTHARSLEAQGEKEDAHLINKALTLPSGKSEQSKQYFYSFGGKPVVICWGFTSDAGLNTGDGEISTAITVLERKLPPNPGGGGKKDDHGEVDSGGSKTDGGTGVISNPVNDNDKTNGDGNGGGVVHPPSGEGQGKTESGGQGGTKKWLLPLLIALLLAALLLLLYLYLKNKEADMSYFEGDLNINQFFVDEKGEPADLNIVFDDKGNGTVSVIGKGHTGIRRTWSGTAKARPEGDNKVFIEIGKSTCSDEEDFDPFTMVCDKNRSECTFGDRTIRRDGSNWKINDSSSEVKK